MTTDPQTPAKQAPSFRKGVLFSGSGTAVSIIFLFLETAIAARLLSQADFGVYVILIWVVNFLVVIVDFGFKTGVTHFIASGDHERQIRVANTALLFRLLLVGLITLLIWWRRDVLLLFDSTEAMLQYAYTVPLLLLFTSLDELFLSVLQGLHAYRQMAQAQLLRSVLRLSLTAFFLIVLQLGIIGLIYSTLISFTLSVIYQYVVLPIPRRLVFQRPLLSEMLRFGFPLHLNRVLWFTVQRLNLLVLALLGGPASVAIYNVAARIPEALQRLSQSYTTVYFPTMTAMLTQGKRDEASHMLNQSLRVISFVTALMAIVSTVFSSQIITIFVSSKYAESSWVFALLMVAFHMSFLVSMMGYTLTAAGYPSRSLAQNTLRTVVNVGGVFLLTPVLGVAGPAYAALLAEYTANPFTVWLLRRSDIAASIRAYGIQTLLLLLGVGAYWWLQPHNLIISALIVVLFVVLNVVLSTISRDDLQSLLPRRLTKRFNVAKQPSS